jgi:plasmid stability protein
MGVNLSIKDVPDDVAERLRQRAARNHRSLQGELMAIVEQAADEPLAASALRRPSVPRMTVEEVAAEARRLWPNGSPSSIDIIRAMRDGRRLPDDPERRDV